MSDNEWDIWCDGNCETDDANFHDDFSGKTYKDRDGNKYSIEKHHYSCVICDKIVQIG